MNTAIIKQDYELNLFAKAMDTLVTASQLIPCTVQGIKSVGISGYVNIDRMDTLAGAMNFLGFKSKTGKYITGANLKKIKQRLTKKYGRKFVSELVNWENVGTRYFIPTSLQRYSIDSILSEGVLHR